MSDWTPAREQYERDGYVIFRNVIDPELVRETQAHVEWLLKKHPDTRGEQLHHKLMAHDPFMVRLVGDERMLDVCEQFIGPNIALFASHYISKPAREGQPVLWHQDGSYWPLEPMEVTTLWLAASESTPENGCMRVIPGTQTLDLKELIPNQDVESVLGSHTPEEYVDESKAVDLILGPGDVSVHHPNIIHGSEPNHSDQPRIGLTIRYIPTTTKILWEQWQTYLLRGEAVTGTNNYLPYPAYREGEHVPFRGCEAWTGGVNPLRSAVATGR